MTYETLLTIASLLEKEKNIREKECELLHEKLNSARDKAEYAPEDEELSHVAEFTRALYEKARKGLLNHERACEDFLSTISGRTFLRTWDKSNFSVET